MGSNTSKATNEAAVQVQKNEAEINSDPRSPTPEISRTPLQGKGGSKHNITKNADLRKTFENGQDGEKLIHNNPILSAVIKNHLQSYDPRSPTLEFERTPIVIGQKTEECDKNALRAKAMDSFSSPCLHDSSASDNSFDLKPSVPDIVPKNLCDGFLNLTFNDTIKDVEEPLGSSTASSDSIERNATNDSLKKPTKLLETNFDFDEKVEEIVESIEDENKEDKEETDNNNYNSKDETTFTNIPKFKVLPQDPRSPTNGIERTPIVVPKIEEKTNDDNVEDMSDDTLIKVLQSTNAELINGISKTGNNPDGILIYEDEVDAHTDTPRKSRSTGTGGPRTPLSCMKNKGDTSHSRSKSVNTLYDPKCLNVAAKKVSHIPRLKSLTKPNKFMPAASSTSLRNIAKPGVIGDCENTPPHSHRDKWDKDTSIVL